jgi:hypothetical protein
VDSYHGSACSRVAWRKASQPLCRGFDSHRPCPVARRSWYRMEVRYTAHDKRPGERRILDFAMLTWPAENRELVARFVREAER